MSKTSPGLNAALLVALFFALLFCGPIIWQGWKDLARTAEAARTFQP